MHATIITFRLQGLSEEDYRAICDKGAPAFADVPGMVSKLWIADSDSGVYGGVYLWEDREAREAYERSDLFAALAADPQLAGMSVRHFDVLTGPSAVTRAVVGAAA